MDGDKCKCAGCGKETVVLCCLCPLCASKIVEAAPSASNNTERDVILAAGNTWYDQAHGGSVDGFIAGAEWALKQTPVL